ncbi:MAG: hypothetical protein Q8J68_00835 [Methanolobus sp.]|uniref:hypothetical protein n=1 Tax=Methanolobus sp. TaxID=1874737 RepID=UPI0027320F9D|nr:hypothetical protein [Methanolobus sp.]MDP2215829.1 hypothetical protein [Methanolobus sp.]
MTERSTPGTGEKKTSKSSFFGSTVDIIYCWMAGENTLLYRTPLSKGYLGHALNLFFPKKSTYIMLDRQKYYAHSMNHDNITLQRLSN